MAGEIFNALRNVNDVIAGRQQNALGAVRAQYAPQMMAQGAEQGRLENQKLGLDVSAMQRAQSPDIQEAQQAYAAAQQVLASPSPAAMVHNAFPEIEAQLRAKGFPIDTDEQAKEAAQYVAAHYGSMLAGQAGKPELPGFVQQNQSKPSALEAAYQTHVQQSKAKGTQPLPFFDNSGQDFVSKFAQASVGAQYGTPQSVPGVGLVVPNKVSGANTTAVPEPVIQGGMAARTGAEANARAVGTATGENQVQLPDALADINKMRGDINNLLAAPGFSTIYGLSGKVDPRNYIPGTDAANAQAKRNTLSSQAFGVAIQKMKGMGSLSNAEGLKVTDAFTRATNPNISEDEARKAWGEVLLYLDAAEGRAIRKAGQSQAPETAMPQAAPQAAPQGPVRVKVDAQGNVIQ